MSFMHLHTHSEFSCQDAFTKVPDIVAGVAGFGHEGIGLTDHGLMAGAVQLYKESRKHGLLPFPGVEAYLVKDAGDKKGERFHLTMLALDYDGYRELVRLVSRSHQRDRFHVKPRIDFSDLAHLSTTAGRSGIAVFTGCYFGLTQQTLVRTGDPARAAATVKMLDKWFDHVFVEVQHHDIERGQGENEVDDDQMVTGMYNIAQEVGLPVIATYDSHYLVPQDRGAHDMMKKLIIRDVEPSEAGFPGRSYHLATTPWVRSHYTRAGLDHVWEDAQKSYTELLNLNTLRIPVLDEYRFYVPEVPGTDSYATVEHQCWDMLNNGPWGGKKKYEDRLVEELAVIKEKGFAGYLLHVKSITDYMRSEGIVFQARGSASASLVNRLLGITQLDPLEWGLLFERFLDPNRTRPPDVDLDMEDVRRDDVIEWLRQTYEVVQIGTYGTLSIRPEDGKGSIIAMYMGYVKRTYPEANIKTIDDAKAHSPEESEHLWELAAIEPRRAPGAHAAGFLIGTTEQSIADIVPTMLIPSSGRTVTQFGMDDAEDMGFVKDDLLGLRNLTTIRRCLELLDRDPAQMLEWVPNDDKEAMKLLRSGNTDGLFQFEGWSNAKVAREMGARRTMDAVIATSLGRPAVLKEGLDQTYIQRKKSRGQGVTYPGPVFRKHLKDTFGVIVFQEQVLAILRDLGMSSADRNALLKAVKASNKKQIEAEKTFQRLRKKFLFLCKKNGMDKRQRTEAWRMVEVFAGYGFNKAHAAQYGLTGYRTAYLKAHFPLEYMAALLETTAGTDKERGYITEARRMKLRLLGPSINDSGVSWTLDRKKKAIRRGLISIKGVGAKAAEDIVANAPFTDLADLADRTDSRAVNGVRENPADLKGVADKLRAAGALTCIGVGRDGW